jgi:zinc protease
MYYITNTRPARIFLAGLFVLLCQLKADAYNYHADAEKYSLSNELTVILEEDHNSPLSSIQVWVRAGSCFEGEFLGSGITHLVEHMVFKGEKSRTSQWISEEIQKLGGEINASTSKEYTQFDVVVPSRNLSKALEIVHGVIAKAEFTEEELNKEMDVILHEMDTILDDPQKFMIQNYFKTAYSGHPFAEPVIGRKDLFMMLKKEDIVKYYRSKYVPGNMSLIICGDFNSDVLKKEIQRLWGSFQNSFLKQDYIPYAPNVGGHTRSILKTDKNNYYMVLGFLGVCVGSSDSYALDVLAQIAGGSEESRLQKRIRDKMGIVSDVSAFNFTPLCAGVWGVNVNIIGSEWKFVSKSILKEIYNFKKFPVSENELKMAKKIIVRRCIEGLATVNGRAYDIGTNEIYTHNPKFTKSYITAVENVRKEDLMNVANKYFSYGNLTLVVLVPKTEEKKQKADFISKGEVKKIDLQNGMRILVQEDKRLPLVVVRLAALGGLLEEGMPGLSYFLSRLWLKEYPDIVEGIEKRGGSISAYSGYDSIGCEIKVFKEDADFAIYSMNQLIQDIKIEKEKLELIRKIQLAEIKQEEDDPYSFAFMTLKEIYFSNHPYKNSMLGDEKSVLQIDAEDIKDYYKRSFTAKNIVIAVFGDIDAGEIKDKCLDVFFKTDTGASEPGKELQKVPEKVNIEFIKKEMEQAIVMLAYPAPNIYDNERYAMEILSKSFSGQAGRLYGSVREKEGLAYSTGALNFNGREEGVFIFYIATKPEEAERTKQILFDEIKKIREEGLKEDELRRSKSRLVTEAEELYETASGFSLETAVSELYGMGWDYYKKYAENIEKVTQDDIKNAINKYFRDDWYTYVVIGKEKE